MLEISIIDPVFLVVLSVHKNAGDDAMSDVMTVRVEPDVKQRLEKLAKATARTKSFLAAEAIRAYLDLNEWQVRDRRSVV